MTVKPALAGLTGAFEKAARARKEEREEPRSEHGGGIILKPHQKRVLEKLRRSPGVLVYHGLGSGKSLTSINAADKLGLPAETVVPASLRPNYKKELAKFKPRVPFHVKSYEGFKKDPHTSGKVLIFDEAHRLQDPASGRTQVALKEAPYAYKRIALTGTPIQNKPEELAPLINTVAGSKVLPLGEEFRKKYVGEETVSPGFFQRYFRGVEPGTRFKIQNRRHLARKLRGLVDYHPSSVENFPKAEESVRSSEMSRKQRKVYDYVAGKVPRSIWNKLERNLPPAKRELENLNAFLSGVRITSNTPAPFQKNMTAEEGFASSPKLRRIVDDAVTGVRSHPRFKTLIYSNYLEGGVLPVSRALEKHGIPHHIYTGGLSDKRRKQIIEDYNSDKVRALLVSGAGAEGLDLKGTRMVQVMEPHWNESRIKQVIGRAVRYKSHDHLPPSERRVDVRHYHATLPKSFMQSLFKKKRTTSADEYMEGLAKRKQELVDQFLDVLKEEGSKE